MNEKVMVIMVGVPRSGKSTLTKEYVENGYKVVSRDIERNIMFGDERDNIDENKIEKAFNSKLKKYIDEYENIVIDNTNISFKRRRGLYDIAIKNKYQIKVKVFYENIKVLKKRAQEDGFPFDKIENQIANQDFYKIEWLDKVKYPQINVEYTTNDDKEISLSLLESIDMCKGFNQNNPHHNDDLYDHMGNTYESSKALCYLASKKGDITKEFLHDIKIATFFHDIGKLYSKRYDSEKGHSRYFGHNNTSAYMLQNGESHIATFLIGSHMKRFDKPISKKFVDEIKSISKILHRGYDEVVSCIEIMWTSDLLSHADVTHTQIEELKEKILLLRGAM